MQAERTTKAVLDAGNEMKGETTATSTVSPNMNWGYRTTKRLFDIVASALAIIVFSPVMLVTAVAIKLEDPHGKVLYKAPRGGKNRIPFACYNLRWMEVVHELHKIQARIRWIIGAKYTIFWQPNGFRHSTAGFAGVFAA